MIPDDRIAEALETSRGNVSAAARELGLSRRQVHSRIESCDSLQDLLADLREGVADTAESVIAAAISSGDTKLAMWYLLSFSCRQIPRLSQRHKRR